MLPTLPLPRSTLSVAATAAVSLGLLGCSPEPVRGPAHAQFDALVAACTQFVGARAPQVQALPDGTWQKTVFSAALVTGEVEATESPVTPFVGKLVIKDNEAQATAATAEQAQARVLTTAHLRTNRTHTLVFRHDGTDWHWANGQQLIKRPPQDDTRQTLSLSDLRAPGSRGWSGCLPAESTQ